MVSRLFAFSFAFVYDIITPYQILYAEKKVPLQTDTSAALQKTDEKGKTMLPIEENYAWRARLAQLFEKDIRDPAFVPEAEDFVLQDGFAIVLPPDADEVLLNGARYLQQFLSVSLDIGALVVRHSVAGHNAVTVEIHPEYESEKAFALTVSAEGISVTAHDSRGGMQAMFLLAEEMDLRRAAAIRMGIFRRKPKFSPRMVHSGYSNNEYPDFHLTQIARAGMDALLVYVSQPEQHSADKNDYADLIRRAAAWGLDVYAYSTIRGKYHPKDPQAAAYYEAGYGELFRRYVFKGVILVGESVGFPSEDENASPTGTDRYVPVGKPVTGFWPCRDYPEYVSLIRDTVRRYRRDADIVFWTYNWAPTPVEKRLELIEKLPTDISLLVTFELQQASALPGTDYKQVVTDYSISHIGPSEAFTTEAEAACRRGIRLYTMANTAGNTWDMGCLPYQPAPYRWLERFAAVCKAKQQYQLTGVMESHAYGFWPSFISECAKFAYETDGDAQAYLDRVLARRFGRENLPTLRRALQLWSDAYTHIPPDAEDQWSAMRIGPAYPFGFTESCAYPKEKGSEGMFYFDFYPAQNEGWHAVSSVRIQPETAQLQRAEALMQEGNTLLAGIQTPNTALEYLMNLGREILCYLRTAIHLKQWQLLRLQLMGATDNQTVLRLCEEAEELLLAERQNACEAIPLVQRDSRLGWDPAMLYSGDAVRIDFKCRYLDYTVQTKLGNLRLETQKTLSQCPPKNEI